MDNLFDIFNRTYLDNANNNYNTYDYYNKSARSDISKFRETLESWFSKYPLLERKDLKSRFKKEFYSPFYELFLYQLFSKLGYNIIIHPEVPNSTKSPDFLISKDNIEIYIEAKVVTNITKEQEALERKKNEFYDNLNKLKSNSFYLDIEHFEILTNKQPSTKGVISYIEKKLNEIDPDLLSDEIEKYGFDKLPIIKYNKDGIHIIVKPIPVKSSARKKIKRPIGIYPVEFSWGGAKKSLRDSIDKKAKRYGKLDKPFIICLNIIDIITFGREDVDDGIWGSLELTISKNSDDINEKWTRAMDGVFLDNQGARLKNLTGVLVTKIFPANIPHANYWLYEHPFTENKMDFQKIGLKYNYVDKAHFVDNDGDDLDVILGISKDWLLE